MTQLLVATNLLDKLKAFEMQCKNLWRSLQLHPLLCFLEAATSVAEELILPAEHVTTTTYNKIPTLPSWYVSMRLPLECLNGTEVLKTASYRRILVNF